MALKNKPITRRQAIEELLKEVWNWDTDCMVSYIQEKLGEYYETVDVIDIESDYNTEFGHYDNDNEEDYVKVIDTKASRLLIDGVKK